MATPMCACSHPATLHHVGRDHDPCTVAGCGCRDLVHTNPARLTPDRHHPALPYLVVTIVVLGVSATEPLVNWLAHRFTSVLAVCAVAALFTAADNVWARRRG